MSIDYRKLLFDVFDGPRENAELTADMFFATRIPDLCPDCDQGDVKHLPYSQTCTHPNAPTIADLLRWGENVAKAMQTKRGPVITGGGYQHTTRELLAALRTEADR